MRDDDLELEFRDCHGCALARDCQSAMLLTSANSVNLADNFVIDDDRLNTFTRAIAGLVLISGLRLISDSRTRLLRT